MAGLTRRGFEGQLFYGTAGSTASTQITNCEDLDYDIDPEKAETTERGAGTNVPIKTERVVALGVTITWKMYNKPADTTLAALRAAASTGAAVALRTKSYSSGTGYDGDVTLSCKNSKPLKGMAMFEFTATPTDDEGRSPQLNA